MNVHMSVILYVFLNKIWTYTVHLHMQIFIGTQSSAKAMVMYASMCKLATWSILNLNGGSRKRKKARGKQMWNYFFEWYAQKKNKSIHQNQQLMCFKRFWSLSKEIVLVVCVLLQNKQQFWNFKFCQNDEIYKIYEAV